MACHRQYFDDLKVGGIFVPAQGSRKAKWSTSKECLWEAPRGMLSKYPLKHLYTPELETREIDDLSRFFRQVLSVPDATWSDLTGELGKMRESGSRDFDRIRSIYHYLYDLRALNSGNLRQVIVPYYLDNVFASANITTGKNSKTNASYLS